MARRYDRPQTQSPGQWTFYRGRWWRFTGTSWVESDEPVENGDAAEATQTLRYHRDGAGTYWLQHPRTGAWHVHENSAWVPSDSAPSDLDPEPLAPAEIAERIKPPSTKRPAPRFARLIILISAAILLVAAVVLLATRGSGTGHGARPPATTPTTIAGHAATPGPSVATTAPTSTPPTATTAPTGLGTVRLRASGVGYGGTRRFSVSGPWDLYYSFNCGNEGIGASDNFIVDVNGYGAASRTTDRGVNTVGSGQSGHQHYDDAGTFSLSVQTNCRWNVRVVEP
jgi:hypothetical protein